MGFLNNTFIRIALGTGLFLLIPLALTIRDGNVENVGWNWSAGDFVFAFVLIFGLGSLFELARRYAAGNTAYKFAAGLALITAFLFVWINAAVGGYYTFGQKIPNSGDLAQMREGSVEQSGLDQATASLRSAIEAAGGADFNYQAQPTYRSYANFGIVQHVNEVKSVGLVDELAIKFSGTTDNEYAEVNPKTNRVVSFHRETDYTGNTKTSAELEQQARAFLSMVYPDFAQVESTLTFADNSKTGRPEGSNHFFTWDDLGYNSKLPEGAEAERAPFVQVGITSSGYIFSYNNTVDLYRDALKEFELTQ